MTSAKHILVGSLLSVGCATPAAKEQPSPVFSVIERPVPSNISHPIVKPIDITAQVKLASAHVDSAVAGTVDVAPVWWAPLPDDLSFEQIVDPKRKPVGSFSFGSVSGGSLTNAIKIEFDGPGHAVMKRHQGNKTAYGTKEIVDLIRYASNEVTQKIPNSAKLSIGNLSFEEGGDIPWSRSHNSGRDADLAFYALDKTTGESVRTPDLVAFNGDGTAPRFPNLLFDDARNWKLVESIVMYDQAEVQWLFISIPLKERLLAHAKAIGAPAEAIRRASSVLHQPTDSSPHRNHLHLRLRCPKNDRLDGCLPSGPVWDWNNTHRELHMARAQKLMSPFPDGSKKDKLTALTFLESTRSPFGAEVALTRGISDSDSKVRSAAIRLAKKRYSWSPFAIDITISHIENNGFGGDLRSGYDILRRSLNERAFAFSRKRLVSAPTPAERALAATALSHDTDPQHIDYYISALENADAKTATALTAVLERVTVREGLKKLRTPEQRIAATQEWRQWRTQNAEKSRRELVDDMFAKRRITLTYTMSDFDVLIPLLESDDAWMTYTVNRLLRDISGRWSPLEEKNGTKLYERWNGWWTKNRNRFIEPNVS